jgi:RNA polymerase sigma-70 factor (ECF subfamily)
MPPKQRAVLLLRDVLGFSAEETAETLDLTVIAANSALQRAREAIDARRGSPGTRVSDSTEREILGRYVRAWEEADVGLLVSLLREDAKLSMPPLPFWLQGAGAIGTSIGAMVLRPESRGAFRAVLTRANGEPAVAIYRRDGERWVPMALHVLRIEDGAIAEMVAFMDARVFESFGLPNP